MLEEMRQEMKRLNDPLENWVYRIIKRSVKPIKIDRTLRDDYGKLRNQASLELSHCQFTELHHLPKGSFLYQQGESAHTNFIMCKQALVGLFHTL